MKKTMRKSALLSSVAMLIVSAIVLTSATYAWFSSSKKVYVEELEASVKVSTGLLISVDKGGEWGTQVDFADAVAVKDGWVAGVPERFDPVSTSNGNDWITAVFEETDLSVSSVTPGEKFVAVPLWVTGPIGDTVKAVVNFDGTDATAAKNVKFALIPTTDGQTATGYSKAVAADGSSGTFNGVSAKGTTDTTENSAYVTSGGTTVSEVAADGGITFTIAEGTSTDAPMMFLAYIWLEGNDPDCKMLDFDVAGEDITFAMSLEIVE